MASGPELSAQQRGNNELEKVVQCLAYLFGQQVSRQLVCT